MVRKRIIEKVVAAGVAALILEVSGELLDRVGLSEEEHRDARVFAQNMISAVTGVIMGTLIVGRSNEKNVTSEEISTKQPFDA